MSIRKVFFVFLFMRVMSSQLKVVVVVVVLLLLYSHLYT
jgi:hypothetical protein